ncbi:uncharacterized protein LOC114829678 [Esox lucius]|uniref:uncharacterized protein LOC114829678 n=1 Tax=Esox lucius TaxID=8010 RepID=UPI001476E741|nr:uncharacterized protein LOC114829678 [Esox lucius]
MPLLESTCCTNCHKLLQRIAVLETKLFVGSPSQTEHTTELHRGHPQHTAGESHESNAPQQTILSVEKQADRLTHRWHKQGAKPKGIRDIRLSRVSHIAAVASSTPNTALTRIANTGLLSPPIHLENRFDVLLNEESPNLKNVFEHRLNQPVANSKANRRSRLSRQRHSAQSTAEPRTLIVGDSIIKNISSRDTTTCCLPQATTSDVNRELQNILMKHKTANRLVIHVGKNDIHKEQSELLKKDFNELFETLKRLTVQTFISGPLPARGTNRFSRLLGLNTWLQKTCNIKGVNFIDNFNLFWSQRQLFKQNGHQPNKLGSRVLKDNIYFFLRHPSANPHNQNGTYTSGHTMNDHRTSLQHLNGHAVNGLYKDNDNTTQPQQPLLMDTISAEPCPPSISSSMLPRENGETGVCWNHIIPLFCKPPDTGQKTAGSTTTKAGGPSSPSSCEISSITTPGPTPSSFCSRCTKNN